MFTSIRIFALKNFFFTCCFISNKTKLKKCILKLSSIYLCIKLKIKQHVRHNLIFSLFSWAFNGVLVPNRQNRRVNHLLSQKRKKLFKFILFWGSAPNWQMAQHKKHQSQSLSLSVSWLYETLLLIGPLPISWPISGFVTKHPEKLTCSFVSTSQASKFLRPPSK